MKHLLYLFRNTHFFKKLLNIWFNIQLNFTMILYIPRVLEIKYCKKREDFKRDEELIDFNRIN